jgi:hypothetical protein
MRPKTCQERATQRMGLAEVRAGAGFSALERTARELRWGSVVRAIGAAERGLHEREEAVMSGSSMKAWFALVAIVGVFALYANAESSHERRLRPGPNDVANQAIGWQSAVPGLAVGP